MKICSFSVYLSLYIQILEYDRPVPVQVGQPVLIPLYSGVRAGFLSPTDDFSA